MSEWKKVKLGDITDSCLGKMLDAARNRGEYKPYLANLNVRWGSFDTDRLSLMRFEEDENERYGIKYGDLIICEGGEPGRCAIWKEQLPDMKIQKALHRVRPKEELVDNFYLFYWFLLAGKRNWIDQYCTGATIKHLPGQKLKEVVVDLPPINVQHRIATTLSRYDSLIENYQKQIKLLEEAAQRLYKEWFVDLRFPGHETTKIVDGVPEGWEKKKVTDILDVKYGKDHKQLKGGNIPVYGTGGVMRFVDKSLYTGESVLIPRKGSLNNIIYVNETFWTIDTMFYSIPKIENAAKIVYFYLSSLDMYSMNIGAAVPSMTVNILSGMEVLLPPNNVRLSFEKMLVKYFNGIKKLSSQIRLLTEARDRLLPKLMSGVIAV